MIIIGAGLSGCLAGALNRKARLYEAGLGVSGQHRAVLRFREDTIGHALGIPFKKVRVRKGIVVNGVDHHVVTPALANRYAQKVTGRITERSINNLDPVDRFIAPGNLHEILGEMCHGRIEFGTTVDATSFPGWKAAGEPIVSTIPLPSLLHALGVSTPHQFDYAGITVSRWQVPGCDVHQTLYFPGEETSIYRATLTDEDLIVEGVREFELSEENYIAKSFFFSLSQARLVSRGSQRYGKIIPLPDNERKELLLKITLNHNIYSLGRFACWRNILLDDVYYDYRKIEQMIKLNHYDLMRTLT